MFGKTRQKLILIIEFPVLFNDEEIPRKIICLKVNLQGIIIKVANNMRNILKNYKIKKKQSLTFVFNE